jgi:hypothetical protein
VELCLLFWVAKKRLLLHHQLLITLLLRVAEVAGELIMQVVAVLVGI